MSADHFEAPARTDGERLEGQDAADAVMKDASPAQRRLASDKAKRRVLCKARRVGATEGWMRILIAEGMLYPGSSMYYVARDIKRGIRRIWNPIFKLNHEINLGLKPHLTSGEVRFPNESRIIISSSASVRAISDERGEAIRAMVPDEAQLIEDDVMTELVEGVFEAGALDTDGWIALSGTPGDVFLGLFYDVAGPQSATIQTDSRGRRRAMSCPYLSRDEPRWKNVTHAWSYHHWSLQHDAGLDWAHRHDPEWITLWERALKIKEEKGWADDHPKWVREFLGRWMLEPGTNMYRFDPAINLWIPGPPTPANIFGLPS